MKKNKTIAIITALLTLTSALIIASSPYTNAAVVEVNTFLFVMASPNPVGVGQSVLITVQLDKPAPNAVGVTGGTHFGGFVLEITKPDGTKESKGPTIAYATSSYSISYTPSQVGTYKLQASFPGQWDNTTSTYVRSATAPYSPNTQYWFKPDTSEEVELIVQQDPTPDYSNNVQSQNEQWYRPINAENKDWGRITDNWLMEGYDYDGRRFPSFGAFAPYSRAPNSAHILWNRQQWFGGVGGGQFGDKAYYSGLSYEQPYLPLILQGRIIYSEHAPTTSARKYGTRCLDLYTGKENWYLENVTINFAQVFAIENPNEHGLIAHLWAISGTSANQTWRMYDGFSGNFQMTMTNVTTGTTTFGPNGEMLSYSISGNLPNRRLILWNSTWPLSRASTGTPGEYYSPVAGSVANGEFGIQYNVSMPNIPGIIKYVSLEENKIITINFDSSVFPFNCTFAAYEASSGNHLWTKNIGVNGLYAPNRLPYSPKVIRDGTMVVYDDAIRTLYGYDLKTGSEKWKTDSLPEGWAYFNQAMEIAYGSVFMSGYDGYVRAYNASTGALLWNLYLGDAGLETHYPSWPVYAGFTIADRKIFFTNDDHSPDSVLWRGGKINAVNVDTGQSVWNISGWFRIPAVADGYLTAANSLDGKIYVFGKGPSATKVSIQNDIVPIGKTVLIKGEVLDVSPGTEQFDQSSRFPNGVPCVSDESQSAWMEYVYMQKARPTDVKGVTVELSVVDANGNYRTIGTTTADADGFFSYNWMPDIEGKYTVYASFAGSESYWPSHAVTAFNVDPAPATPTPAPVAEQPPTDMYIIGATTAIIIAIAIVGTVLLLAIRKRP